MRIDLAAVIENNIKFIQQYSFDEWVSKLKLVAIACIPFLSSAKIKEIMDTKNYSVEYNELGINQIVIIANSPEWDSVKITLNCMGILVSRQEGHSKFESVNTIPLEVLRMFADK